MREGRDKVGPADFVAEGDVHFFGEMKPGRADGYDGQREGGRAEIAEEKI